MKHAGIKIKLLLCFFVLMTLPGCSKDFPLGVRGKKVAVRFDAGIELTGTKAGNDGDGTGEHADECRLQVYLKKDGLSALVYDAVHPVENLKATFDDISLVANQDYDFLFWADNAEGSFYDTDNLKAVKFKGTYVGNDDRRDAFSASYSGRITDGGFRSEIVLTRPFGQFNVICTDVQDLPVPPGKTFEQAVPERVSLSFTSFDTFNVLDGQVSGSSEFSYEAEVYSLPYRMDEGERNTLAMDYIFAPSGEGNIINFHFTAVNSHSRGSDIELKFDNVPVRRNFRTNLVGSLLGSDVTVHLEISPSWSGEREF